jgi:hypothetical protein
MDNLYQQGNMIKPKDFVSWDNEALKIIAPKLKKIDSLKQKALLMY